MPTTRPRYQVTDTGQVQRLLDRASAVWPNLAGDRKALLLRLAAMGGERLPEPGAPSLGEQLRRHLGEWVAVRDQRLLIAAPAASEVVAWLREHGERAEQMYRVPTDVGDIPAEHGLA